jgi:hypothetical protein
MSTTAPRRSRAGLALVVTAQVQAVLVFAQALFAGLFLSGQGTWLAWHRLNGLAVVALGLVTLVLAGIVRARGGPVWPVLATAGIAAALIVQFFSGFAGAVALHVPLGVAIFGVAIALRINASALTAPSPSPTPQGA